MTALIELAPSIEVASPNSIGSVPISEKIKQITDKHFLIQVVSMLILLKSIMFSNSVHTIFRQTFQASPKSEITIKFSELMISQTVLKIFRDIFIKLYCYLASYL